MAVSTIYQTKKTTPLSSIVVYALLVLGFLSLVYFGFGFIRNLNIVGGKSKLTADLYFGTGEVFLDGEKLGDTPFESSEIKPGEHKVTISSAGVSYDVTLNFLANSEVAIKRDLGVSQTFSAGQNFWFEKSDSDAVLSVISEPSGADVYIDDSKVGTTPFSSNNLTAGDYEIRISQTGYEEQTARIEIIDDHKLNVSATLFPAPVPSNVNPLQDSTQLYDVASDISAVTSDVAAWVKAITYWNETRGIDLAGVGVNKDTVFDFYLGYNGDLFTAMGTKITAEEAGEELVDAERGAYLRKISDGDGLSEAARTTYTSLGEVASLGKQATVLETGTGWLRVRDEPGLDGAEITTINVGETFAVLEEATGWVKLRISADVEGWVSDTYVEISE